MRKSQMEQERRFVNCIEQSVTKNWNKDVLADYKGITLRYKDTARKIARFHIVLESAGIQPGDKIVVYGWNSVHQGVTFSITIIYGAVIVPIPHEFKAGGIHNTVNHSEAKLLFIDDQAQENLNEDVMPLLEGITSFTDLTTLVSCNEKLTYVFEHRNAVCDQRYPKNFRPEHVCYQKDRLEEPTVISYTSDTTGYSKGVMLPYRSVQSDIAYCFEMLPVKADDHTVSMFLMGHVFGMVYDFSYGFSAGAHIYFLTRMPSPKIITQSSAEIKPRVISCVSLIAEKIIKKDVLPRVDSKAGKLLLKVPIVDDKVKPLTRQVAVKTFGGNFDGIVIGDVPLNTEVETFLKKMGLPHTIAYGMTECGPIIYSSRWETLKPASCGKAVTRVEVYIDSPDPKTHTGEVVYGGMDMVPGYYKNPEATAQVIDANGRFHTGDLGIIDDEEYVTVRGRSENLLLTSSKQNIYPEKIESKLNSMPYVAESLIVLQYGRSVALIYPDFSNAFAHGLQQADIIRVMEAGRVELNQQPPNYSQVSRVKIRFEEFERTTKKPIRRFTYREARG